MECFSLSLQEFLKFFISNKPLQFEKIINSDGFI